MLSKSQARAFFLAGTAVCGLAFIGLTVDTFGHIPAQTHADKITPEVARGKELWDHNNCMGCHTLLGEGAYYAPELTKVYTRRGPTFIQAMLKDPAAMYPGQRQMQKYDFTDADIAALTAFLQWIGEIDSNGFPPTPALGAVAVPSQEGSGLARIGNRPQIFNQLCIACHSLGGQGGQIGPALDDVASRRDANYLRTWLQDPGAVKPGTKMPKLPLSDGQISELVAFLANQNKQ